MPYEKKAKDVAVAAETTDSQDLSFTVDEQADEAPAQTAASPSLEQLFAQFLQTLNGQQATKAAEEQAKADAEKSPFDGHMVTVLHGYGRVDSKEKKWIDNTFFLGGVARHVPYDTVREWKKKNFALDKGLKILPDDTPEYEFARAVGIQPMATSKFAAMLAAMNLDELAHELGVEKTSELAAELQKRIEGKTVRDTSGKFRKREDETPAIALA